MSDADASIQIVFMKTFFQFRDFPNGSDALYFAVLNNGNTCGIIPAIFKSTKPA
jgi:hypothetical protein